MYTVRTRFIPNAITAHFEQCAWPLAARKAGSAARKTAKPVDIGARIKSLWR
jgi:DNA helicase-2/ATP-dependent DNA helicase PcrA